MVLALGLAATLEAMNGKAQAGKVLKGSCTPGLLLRDTPSTVKCSPICVVVAARRSMLSIEVCCAIPS